MIDYEKVKKSLLKELYTLNPEILSKFSVVTMFEFIMDHTLVIPDINAFVNDMKRIIKQGGGELPLPRQSLHRGGGGANVASGLGKLGLSTYFIGRTNILGKSLLDFFFNEHNVNIDYVKIDGNLGLTLALEVGDEKTNIMVGDLDSYSELNFTHLTPEDLELISKCNLVGIFNWTLNKTGTELAEGIFSYIKKFKTLTYLDTGDPNFRTGDIKKLHEKVISSPYLDIFSVNENELNSYCNFISDSKRVAKTIDKALLLKKSIHAKLDLHASSFAASFIDDKAYFAPVFKIKPLKKTGAGDSWNTGNILGYFLKLEPEQRLMLSNGLACCYISSYSSAHPDLNKLCEFIASTPFEEMDYKNA